MRLLVLFYFALSIFVSGNMIYRGMTWPGSALVIGSIIGFAAGSGARGGTYLGQRRILLFAGMGVVFYSDVTVSVFGVELAGDVWVVLGAAIGWFAAKPEDAEFLRGVMNRCRP
jgi:hypothetical protein